MGAAKPTYLVQMQNDWAAKATALQSNYATAEANTLTLRRAASENRSLEAAATQAALAEQTAAKAYNDFLKTGSAAYQVAQDIDSTLNGPRNLSTLERHQLQTEKRNLEAAWEAFNDFTQTHGLKPTHRPPVYADNRIHHVDGTTQWDTGTTIGQLGSMWDAGKAAIPHVIQAATQSEANQYLQCVGTLDGLIGGFAGKLVPGHAPWGQMTSDLWEQHVGKAFTSAGSESLCRLVYPQPNAPEFLRKYGAVNEGYDETLGAVVAIDIAPAKSSTLSWIRQWKASERWAHLAVGCSLVMALAACASQPAGSRLDRPSTEETLLDQLAALPRVDTPRIDLDVLSALADANIRALVQAQKGAPTSDGVVSVTKGIATPGAAVTAVTYRLAPAGPAVGVGRHTTEQVILILNPLVACITDQSIRQQWGQAVQSGRLGALRYGAGGLWPMDGLHRNKDEQARRGNGPVEVIVPVATPSNTSHTSRFRFTHEYWQCARSAILERRF